MPFSKPVFVILIFVTFSLEQVSWAQLPLDSRSQAAETPPLMSTQVPQPADLAAVSQLDGVHFVSSSNSQILLEKDGKQYLIDAQAKTIHEVSAQAQGSSSG